MRKRRSVARVLPLAFFLLMFSGTMFAHHSANNYNFEDLYVLEGTVTRFDFVNPHITIRFDVTNNKGENESWSATGASPNSERRFNWNQSVVKPGDHIVVYGFVQRDGLKTLQMPIIVLNGKVIERQHSTEFRLYEEYKQKHPNKLPVSYAGKPMTQMEPKGITLESLVAKGD